MRTNLWIFSRFVLNARAWGTVESYAALVLLDGLARELGEHEPLVVGRTIDREALARVLLAVRRHPPREITRAAASLWAELFGEPLPPLARSSHGDAQ